MTSVLETVPPGTQAEILERVAAERWPRQALPTIAFHFKMPVTDLQVIVNKHGYPDADAMRKAARGLRSRAESNGTHLQSVPDPDVEEPYTETLQTVKVTDLHPDPDNPRTNFTDIEELAESIQSIGLLQPIVARRHQGRLLIVAGERRWRAVKLLHHDTVKAIIRSRMLNDDVLAAMLIENGQRAGLDPIEEARALRRLQIQLDCSETQLGRRIGRSLAYVNGRLLLLNLSVEEQEAIRNGRLGVTAATAKARMDSGRVRPAAVGRPAVGHLSATHELAALVMARCTRLGHSRGKGTGVGGVGCGQCWESVIRADERQHIHTISAQRGECLTCGQQLEATSS